MAWSFILNGFSARFLEKNADSVAKYVETVLATNDAQKLAHMMEFSHQSEGKGGEEEDDNEAYSVRHCSQRIVCPLQVIGGSEDRISGMIEVKKLADIVPNSECVELHTGHLVPFEEPVKWRNAVLHFLALSP